MRDTDYYVRMAHAFNSLREPVLHSAIQALQFPSGSRGLDAGCGIGLQAMRLAETVGSTGRVTGLDFDPEMLARARRIVENSGLSDRIAFKEGNVTGLPFQDNSFDWAWSMDCVGYLPLEPASGARSSFTGSIPMPWTL